MVATLRKRRMHSGAGFARAYDENVASILELTESLEFTSTILNSAADSIILIDDEFRVVDASPGGNDGRNSSHELKQRVTSHDLYRCR